MGTYLHLSVFGNVIAALDLLCFLGSDADILGVKLIDFGCSRRLIIFSDLKGLSLLS